MGIPDSPCSLALRSWARRQPPSVAVCSGIARRCLDIETSYANPREQFGDKTSRWFGCWWIGEATGRANQGHDNGIVMPCPAPCLVMDSMSSALRTSKTCMGSLLVSWSYPFADCTYPLGCPGRVSTPAPPGRHSADASQGFNAGVQRRFKVGQIHGGQHDHHAAPAYRPPAPDTARSASSSATKCPKHKWMSLTSRPWSRRFTQP